MNWIAAYIQYFTQWQNIAMAITAICLYIAIVNKPLWRKLWNGIEFKRSYLIIAIAGLAMLFLREWANFNPFDSFGAVQWYYPTFTIPEQILVWIGTTHFRSILFFAGMIIWLWRKYNRLLPALAVGWFGLAVVELSFIPDMLIDPYTRGFMGLDWYLPFIGTMPLYLFHWREFYYPRRFWIWIAAAVAVQYGLLVFRPWSLNIWDPGLNAFVLNLSIMPHPPWQTWFMELLNHLMKTLFAVAFCYVNRHMRYSVIDYGPVFKWKLRRFWKR